MAKDVNKLIENEILGQGNQVRASVLVEVLQSLVGGKAAVGGPEAFKETETYAKDARVEKDGVWYTFNKQHTGAWKDEDADEVTLYDLLEALETRVAALEA